ncbi:hypothetical protein CDAR_611201 [Caerostris darwini]|uniref:Uncharacterized protein n=1 Tax=Caerostris darwini TaxID=1538125 RepID=A0AAV4TBA7_9ARAC|nr:hypothetical protein CDAR_611201 [Caerostris darwini]
MNLPRFVNINISGNFQTSAISAWSKLIPTRLPPTAGLRIPSKHRSTVINTSGWKPTGLLDPRIHSRTVGFCQLHPKSGQAFRLRQCDMRDRFGFNELLNPSPFSYWGRNREGVDYESIR